MDSQPWLARVRERLAKHALPPNYVQRFLDELSDHLNDLKEENMECDASFRLGVPEQVAEAAVAAYRRRSFLGRHCWARFVVFGISPLVAFQVVMSVFDAVLVPQDWGNAHWNSSLMAVMCSAFLAAFYGELAVRGGVGKKWTLASGAVLGMFAAFFESSEACFARSNLLYALSVAQFAIPLAIGWWFVKREYYHGSPTTTFLLVAISPPAFHLTFSLLGTAVFVALGLPSVAILPILCFLFVLVYLIPIVVAGFICCQLILRSGRDRRWMLISCGVLAMFATMESFSLGHPPLSLFSVGLRICVILSQLVVPLAIGWWSMRRKRDQSQLQLAL